MVTRCTLPRLMLVINTDLPPRPMRDLAVAAAAGGVDAIYLRERAESTSPMRTTVGMRNSGALVVQELAGSLRDRLDPAVTLLTTWPWEGTCPNNIGQHVRERDGIPDRIDAGATRPSLVGRSVHSPESAAASIGVDYVLAGHVYPSASKPGKPPLGLHALARIVKAAPCPVIAIGGITAERISEVMRTGVHGVAVIGAITEAPDPYQAARSLRVALDKAIHTTREARSMPQLPTNSGSSTTFDIIVNGKSVSVPDHSSIHDFLASKHLTGAMAIVEHNGVIIPRGAYSSTVISPGDTIEVVHAVGGG